MPLTDSLLPLSLPSWYNPVPFSFQLRTTQIQIDSLQIASGLCSVVSGVGVVYIYFKATI